MSGNDMDLTAPGYSGPNRRDPSTPVQLTEEQIEQIAERAARKAAAIAADLAVERMTATAYQAIGRGVVNRLVWIVGVVALAAYLWAAKHGLVSLPK